MDIKMKEMDGLAATRLIKAAFPEARIIIVTGHDDAIRALADASVTISEIYAGVCSQMQHKEAS
jgi:DNA-binding NarL/FixJ family response regulator